MTTRDEILAQMEDAAERGRDAGAAAGAYHTTVLELVAELRALDGDPAPDLPVVSIADAVPAQDIVIFPVTLTPVSSDIIVVDWRSLSHPDHFGDLAFQPGQRRQEIGIAAEPGTVTVEILRPSHGTIGRGIATGEVLPADGPPPGSDLSRGRLYSLPAPTTVPVDLPARTLQGVRFAALIVKLSSTGAHRKFAGAESSQSSGQGAFGVGTNPPGRADVWHVGGGAFNQISDPPPMPLRQAVPILWHAMPGAHWVEINGARSSTQALPEPLAEADGLAAVGAGYWKGVRVDPLDGEVRAAEFWSRPLTEEEQELWLAEHADLIDAEPDEPPAPPIPPPPGPWPSGLEPVDPSAHQVTITVGDKSRQTIGGYGFGSGGSLGDRDSPAYRSIPMLRKHIKKMGPDMGFTIARFHTPENESRFRTVYKDEYWPILRDANFKGVFVSGYVYTTANKSGAAPNLKGFANGINAALAWCPILSECVQNEPDGGSQNYLYGSPNYSSRFGDDLRQLNELLDKRVMRLGGEWRHPPDPAKLAAEYDALAAAGVIDSADYHIYNKGSGPTIYDQRWMTRGATLWSTETGDNSAPRCQATFVNDLNNGAGWVIFHIGIGDGDDRRQFLWRADGTPEPWTPALGAIARAMPPGSIMRLCTSSDRPEFMAADQASRMLWRSDLSSRQPRHQFASGLRKDGKRAIVGVNFAFGTNSPSQWAGGHYGALKQQFTVSIPELAGKSGGFVAERVSSGGSMTKSEHKMSDGVVRFTLQPGETLGMTEA